MENNLVTSPLIRQFFKRVNGSQCKSCSSYVAIPSNRVSEHWRRVHFEISQQVNFQISLITCDDILLIILSALTLRSQWFPHITIPHAKSTSNFHMQKSNFHTKNSTSNFHTQNSTSNCHTQKFSSNFNMQKSNRHTQKSISNFQHTISTCKNPQAISTCKKVISTRKNP